MALRLKLQLQIDCSKTNQRCAPQSSHKHRRHQSMFSYDVVSPDQSPVRDIVRPTTYYLTEKQKDDIYVNELTKSVSSATLARAINKYQKTEAGEGRFRKMKQYRISNISDINRVQTHVRTLQITTTHWISSIFDSWLSRRDPYDRRSPR